MRILYIVRSTEYHVRMPVVARCKTDLFPLPHFRWEARSPAPWYSVLLQCDCGIQVTYKNKLFYKYTQYGVVSPVGLHTKYYEFVSSCEPSAQVIASTKYLHSMLHEMHSQRQPHHCDAQSPSQSQSREQRERLGKTHRVGSSNRNRGLHAVSGMFILFLFLFFFLFFLKRHLPHTLKPPPPPNVDDLRTHLIKSTKEKKKKEKERGKKNR
jgi:hypothetical protein